MRERIVVRKHERINYSKNTFYTLLHTHHDKDNYIDYHWHNSIEITYVVKGLKVQCMEDEKIIAPIMNAMREAGENYCSNRDTFISQFRSNSRYRC